LRAGCGGQHRPSRVPACDQGVRRGRGAPAAAVGDPADLLQVHVYQRSGVRALAGPTGPDGCAGQRVARVQWRFAVPAQDSADGALGDADHAGDERRAAARLAAGVARTEFANRTRGRVQLDEREPVQRLGQLRCPMRALGGCFGAEHRRQEVP
jgi:hypothetical protein